MKRDLAYDFFDTASKAVLFIPAVLVVVMFFHIFRNKPAPPVIKNQVVTPSPVQNKFDLKGPFVCFTRTKSASWSAYIEDKKIAAILVEKDKTDKFLIDGDCFYRWTADGSQGQKTCGISPYVSLVEHMLASGILSPDAVIDSASDPQNAPIDPDVLKKLIKSCYVKKTEDRSVFEIPKDKVFEEMKGE